MAKGTPLRAVVAVFGTAALLAGPGVSHEANEVMLATINAVRVSVVEDACSKPRALRTVVVKFPTVQLEISFADTSDINVAFNATRFATKAAETQCDALRDV